MTDPKRLRAHLAALPAALLVTAGTVLPAQPSQASEARWKVGSAVATVFYAPAKAVYATLGVVFGGIGWGLSGGDDGVFDAVIGPAVNGDYVVRPAHLRGERSLEFVGRADDAPALATADDPDDDPYGLYAEEYPYPDEAFGGPRGAPAEGWRPGGRP